MLDTFSTYLPSNHQNPPKEEYLCMTSANAFIFVAPFLSPWSSVFCHFCPLGWTSSIPFPDPIFNAGQQQQALVLALPRANDEGNNNPLLSQQPRTSSTFSPSQFVHFSSPQFPIPQVDVHSISSLFFFFSFSLLGDSGGHLRV